METEQEIPEKSCSHAFRGRHGVPLVLRTSVISRNPARTVPSPRWHGVRWDLRLGEEARARAVRALLPRVGGLNPQRRLAQKIQHLVGSEVLQTLPRRVADGLSGGDLRYLCWVQAAIYELDYYGEYTFLLKQDVLGRIWQRILEVLRSGSVPGVLVNPELERLRAYQAFEERIHRGWYPTLEDGLEALEYKSSDIVLLKKIAIWLSGERRELVEMERHREVARVREVYDDLEDIGEDRNTWNFNLFLTEDGVKWVKEKLMPGVGSDRACDEQVVALARARLSGAEVWAMRGGSILME